jgi:hypothetical protein
MVINLLLLLAKQVLLPNLREQKLNNCFCLTYWLSKILFRRLNHYFSLSQPGKQVLLLILQEQKFNNCIAFAFNKEKQL